MKSKDRRKIYYMVGSDKDIYNLISEYKISKNFICLKKEAENLDCSYFNGGVKNVGRYSQGVSNSVREIVNIKLKHKMTFEEVIFINGFGSNHKNLIDMNDFANSYFYEMIVLFVNDKGFNVSDKKIKLFDMIKRGKYNFKYEESIDQKSSFYSFLKTTDEVTVNFDSYNKIFSFGDIHGCIEPLNEFESVNGFNDDELYIFVGDYFDRGLDNVELFKFIIRHIDKENFIFLIGNHEKSLYRHFIKSEGVNTFTKERYPEFKKEGYSDSQMMDVYNKMYMYMFASFDGEKYMFNHGGICDKPHRPALETGFIYTNGNKSFDMKVDTCFNKNQLSKSEKHRWIQIHGHRNVNYACNIDNNDYSYSLECKIEFGGSLGICEISKNGLKFMYIENFKY